MRLQQADTPTLLYSLPPSLPSSLPPFLSHSLTPFLPNFLPPSLPYSRVALHCLLITIPNEMECNNDDGDDALHSPILLSTALHYTVMHCTVLYHTVISCTVPSFPVLYSHVLCYTVLSCTELSCVVPQYCAILPCAALNCSACCHSEARKYIQKCMFCITFWALINTGKKRIEKIMNYGQTDSQLRIDSVVRIQDQNLESHKKNGNFHDSCGWWS